MSEENQSETTTVMVPVYFRGYVSVRVPVDISEQRKRVLAAKLAAVYAIAAISVDDAPIEQALDEYSTLFDLTDEVVDNDLSQSAVLTIGGTWASSERGSYVIR